MFIILSTSSVFQDKQLNYFQYIYLSHPESSFFNCTPFCKCSSQSIMSRLEESSDIVWPLQNIEKLYIAMLKLNALKNFFLQWNPFINEVLARTLILKTANCEVSLVEMKGGWEVIEPLSFQLPSCFPSSQPKENPESLKNIWKSWIESNFFRDDVD